MGLKIDSFFHKKYKQPINYNKINTISKFINQYKNLTVQKFETKTPK